MLVRLSDVEGDSSEDKKRNKGVTQGLSTQDITIELDLLYFSSIWAVVLIFLIDYNITSSIADLTSSSLLFTINYLLITMSYIPNP